MTVPRVHAPTRETIMDRNKFEDLLADYLGDELGPEDRRAFEEHLATSDTDRVEVESLLETLRCLRELPPPAATPPSSPPIEWVGPPVIVRYLYRPLAYAAVLLIGIGIGWFARPEPRTEAPIVAPSSPAKVTYASQRWPLGKAPSRLVLNARALSTAFTQPTGARGPRSRPTG